jgi:hypothetical protein
MRCRGLVFIGLALTAAGLSAVSGACKPDDDTALNLSAAAQCVHLKRVCLDQRAYILYNDTDGVLPSLPQDFRYLAYNWPGATGNGDKLSKGYDYQINQPYIRRYMLIMVIRSHAVYENRLVHYSCMTMVTMVLLSHHCHGGQDSPWAGGVL